MMDRFKGTKGTVIIIILVCLVLSYYYYLSNKTVTSKPEEEIKASPVQEILLKNYSNAYPPTPKEVLKYYSEITRCFYSEKYTEDELVELALKSRELFDDELYATQTDEQYLIALQ